MRITEHPAPAVLITGASSGIGACCARYLAQQGYRVYAGARSPEALSALRGEGVTPLRLDVTSEAHWRAAMAQISHDQPQTGLFALIANAGVGYGGPVEHLPLETYRRQFEVNYFAVIRGIQACLPLLRRYGRGSRIVGVSSVNGQFVTPFLTPYCGSKFALEALCESLRYELAPDGIHCSLIQPGMVKTPIFANSLRQLQQLRAEMAPEGLHRYAPIFARFEKSLNAAGAKGIPPEAVALALARVLQAPRPRLRYPVGRDARVILLLRKLLSDAWLEALVSRAGIHRREVE